MPWLGSGYLLKIMDAYGVKLFAAGVFFPFVAEVAATDAPTWLQDVTPLGLLAIVLWVVLNRQAAAQEETAKVLSRVVETLARLETRLSEKD